MLSPLSPPPPESNVSRLIVSLETFFRGGRARRVDGEIEKDRDKANKIKKETRAAVHRLQQENDKVHQLIGSLRKEQDQASVKIIQQQEIFKTLADILKAKTDASTKADTMNDALLLPLMPQDGLVAELCMKEQFSRKCRWGYYIY